MEPASPAGILGARFWGRHNVLPCLAIIITSYAPPLARAESANTVYFACEDFIKKISCSTGCFWFTLQDRFSVSDRRVVGCATLLESRLIGPGRRRCSEEGKVKNEVHWRRKYSTYTMVLSGSCDAELLGFLAAKRLHFLDLALYALESHAFWSLGQFLQDAGQQLESLLIEPTKYAWFESGEDRDYRGEFF